MACSLLLDRYSDHYDFYVNKRLGYIKNDYLVVYLSGDSVEMEASIDNVFTVDTINDVLTLGYSDDLNTYKLHQMINYYTRQIVGDTSAGILLSLAAVEKLMIVLYERLDLIVKNIPLTQELLDELCGVVTVKSANN